MVFFMLAIMRLSDEVCRRTFVRSSGWVMDAAMDAATPVDVSGLSRRNNTTTRGLLTSQPQGILFGRRDGLVVLGSHGEEW